MRSRTLIAVILLAVSAGCGFGSPLFQDYEYEEELYLSLDGSATVYVNSSLAALNALRGSAFDTDPSATVDTRAVRAFFTSSDTTVTRINSSRRHGRRYVHVRMDVTDVRRLSSAPPFAWSSYAFAQDGGLFVYRQTVRAPAPAAASRPHPGWAGDELVAFRLHLPSKVVYHNVDRIRRGNILAWEQPLAARLAGVALELDARMETQSILYRTLWLFFAALLAVAAVLALILWRLTRTRARLPLPAPGNVDARPGAPV